MSDCKETLEGLFRLTAFPFDPQSCAYGLLGNKKIILYGAGEGFITFSSFVLRKYGFKAHLVLDRKFKAADTCFGIPASSPFEYKPTRAEKEGAVVVVTVGKREFHGEIFKCLSSLGFRNVVLSTDIYEYHLLFPPAELEKKGFNYYLEKSRSIMKCFGMLSDDLSRQVFTSCIQSHMLRKPLSVPCLPPGEQYFPKDINLRKGYSRFINCGAYDGDSVMRLNNLFGKVSAVACFEPDRENFELLSRYLCAGHNGIADSVIAFPCGVFSSEIRLPFEGGNKSNSMISDRSSSLIQCVALDHALPGFNPTFIQMDVEGVELDALRGAEMLIRDNKPDLAICVYHAPNHIWEVPLFIDGLGLGYKFFLRNYSSFISETVLYATT